MFIIITLMKSRSSSKEGITLTDLRTLYLTPAEISEQNIHPLTVENFQQQEQRIADAGGLDLMLWLRADGHFCGNMPTTTHLKRNLSSDRHWFRALVCS